MATRAAIIYFVVLGRQHVEKRREFVHQVNIIVRDDGSVESPIKCGKLFCSWSLLNSLIDNILVFALNFKKHNIPTVYMTNGTYYSTNIAI